MIALIEEPSTNAVATPRGAVGPTSDAAVVPRAPPTLGAGCATSRSVEGSSVGASTKYEQRKLTCRLKDCAAVADFSTHLLSDGQYLSVDVSLKVKQRGRAGGTRHARVVFVLAKIDGRCYVTRNRWEDILWLEGASLKIDSRDLESTIEFLASLGVRIEDDRKSE